jgi:hypothetical protein
LEHLSCFFCFLKKRCKIHCSAKQFVSTLPWEMQRKFYGTRHFQLVPSHLVAKIYVLFLKVSAPVLSVLWKEAIHQDDCSGIPTSNKMKNFWALVADAYNPSYLGSRGQEDHCLGPAQANSFRDPI